MSSKKILVTGSSGLLGYNLCRSFVGKGYQHVIGQFNQSKYKPDFISTKAVDLTDYSAADALLNELSPDIIINCAALTNVDLCETNPRLALSVNRDICKNITCSLNNKSVYIIHISTDQLWNGFCKMVTEQIAPNPLNMYGLSKLAGEQIISGYSNHLILRTNFFGDDLPWRQSFTGWLDRQFEKNILFPGFEDVFYTPIGIENLIDIIIQSMSDHITGLYHAGGAERLSKYDFAVMYAQAKGYNASLVKKSSVKNSNLFAKRPAEMSMDSSKIASALNIKLPTVHDSLSRLFLC